MRQFAIHSHHVRCLAYSPDSKLLATASNDRSVRVLDATTGKMVRQWKDQGAVMVAVALHPGGERIAFGGQRHRIATDAWYDQHVRLQHLSLPGTLTSLAYLPDGKTLLAGTGDRILRRERGWLCAYNGERIQEQTALPILGGIHHLAVRPDGKQVALGTGYGHRLLDVSGWELSPPCWGTSHTAPAVAYSPDSTLLAVARGFDILLDDFAHSQNQRRLKGHRGKVVSFAFTPDGRYLISGSWDRTVRIWPTAGGPETALAWERGKVQYVAVAPDGMTAAAACDKGVVVWDLDA